MALSTSSLFHLHQPLTPAAAAAAAGAGATHPLPPSVLPAAARHRPISAVDAAETAKMQDVEVTNDKSFRRCGCFDLYKELVPYKEAWSWQKSLVRRRHSLIDKNEDHSDMLIILQHLPVYTLGTGSLEKYLNFDIHDAPHEIHRTDRGGEVTYHGPGQIILYPIVNLRYHRMDLHWYLRSLEEVVIRVLQSTFSIKASRLDGLTGVWVGNQKVAAIGIHVSRWIAYHGLALNVTTDLTPFGHIVPCGIRNRQVGSLSGLLGQSSSGRTMDDVALIDVTHASLLKEFSEVFQLSLENESIYENEFIHDLDRLVIFGERKQLGNMIMRSN